MSQDVSSVARFFATEGDFLGVMPYGRGHIHDTFLARFRLVGSEQRIVFQRLNERVFADPFQLMDNMERVTAHLQARLAKAPGADPARETVRLVPGRDGQPCVRDSDGRCWRAYHFVEGVTHNVCASPDLAREAAKVVGRFQRLLADLPPPRLRETIPYFHHTPRRIRALEMAVAAADVKRRVAAEREIAFVRSRLDLSSLLTGPLERGDIPERVMHGDTKLNNVVFDAQTGRGLCLVDLDTCMPGSALYDFGDMVRSMTCSAAEDERDLSKVRMDGSRFEAIVRGYMEEAGSLLSRREVELLPVAGRVLAFTVGVRFLTDYLSGDVYFKTQRPDQNLDRCRTQFKLVENMEEQEEKMEEMVNG
jgi:Ser/Thr protein kinase RdoA (MazF antagonist)